MEFSFKKRSGTFSPDPVPKPKSLLDLPPEILLRIFKLVPRELKLTCKRMYVFNNSYFYEKLIHEMGQSILYNIAVYDLPSLVKYVQSFDYWRKIPRELLANYNHLGDHVLDREVRKGKTPSEVVSCKYVADSWQLVYSIYKNRRLFIEYSDYQVDEPDFSLRNGLLYIHNTYIVKYKKTIKLSPGVYSLSCGVVVKNALGFSSTNFKVVRSSNDEVILNYFPPTNMKDLIPQEHFTLLDAGLFTVEPKSEEERENQVIDSPLIDVDIIVEETGLFLKSGFVICFLDVNGCAEPDYTRNSKGRLIPIRGPPLWIAWWADNMKPSPGMLVNKLLKDLYKSINRSLSIIAPSTHTSPYQRIGSFADIYNNDDTSDTSNGVVHHLETIQDNQESEGTENSDLFVQSNGEKTNGKSIPPIVEEDNEFWSALNSPVDVETYNQKFYSPFNGNGEPLVRSFRFYDIIGKREYERRRSLTKEDHWFPKKNEPLKWKMNTWFQY
ncbi:unnamed protein product [Ambrosiozyma monospora]|uniref:Unnamed protein product n=1 Tax=Ambrosiozyma monospora TaxID=43982 RepID=A0A9W6YYU5_AMBMO|nr:unnamed protein product [Ambrosiozyma monospora]